MDEAKVFFEVYPEAKDILPVYSSQTVMQWTGEKESAYPLLSSFDSFPVVRKEHLSWIRKNLTTDNDTRKAHEQETAKKYIDMFQKRISELVNFIGPKTNEQRIKDIIEIRNEFFAYPVEIEASFLETLQGKEVGRFVDISEKTLQKQVLFRDYYIEAIEYSQAAAPHFDQDKHLSPHFSGFVIKISIREEDAPYWLTTPKFEAQGGYIQNGKIIWSIHNGHGANSVSVPDYWKDSVVEWHYGDFVLKEVYIDYWGRRPDQPAPKPSSQERKATFQFSDELIKEVQVIQRLNRDNRKEEFVISIINADNTHKTFTANQSTHTELISQIKSDPTFLSNVDNVVPLLQE